MNCLFHKWILINTELKRFKPLEFSGVNGKVDFIFKCRKCRKTKRRFGYNKIGIMGVY